MDHHDWLSLGRTHFRPSHRFFFTMVFSTLKPNCHILKFHLFGKGEVDSSYDSFLTVDWWFQEDGFLLVLVKGQIFGSPADVE